MTIDVIWKELMDLITAIFRGTSFLTLVSVMGIFATAYTQIKKYILKKQSELIKTETARIDKAQNDRLDQQDLFIQKLFKKLDSINVNVLRIQILQGIRDETLSKSEIAYLYDKYTKAGGNSFVTDKVEEYLARKDIK